MSADLEIFYLERRQKPEWVHQLELGMCRDRTESKRYYAPRQSLRHDRRDRPRRDAVIALRVNGEQFALDGSTISDLLAQTGRDPQRVAVEINGDICRRADYGGRTLNEGDSVEIVSLVGGG